MGKENMKEPVPRDLPPMLFLGHFKEQIAPATNPILDKKLNEFRKGFSDITRVAKKANCNPINDVKELSDIKTYDCETFIRKLLHQISFDYRVTLGFGSIAGGLDHVNPVIRLPIKHGVSRDNNRSGIVKPKIGDDVEFKINSNFMRELRRKRFAGTDDEDAHKLVQRILEIIDLFHFPGVIHDAVMLKVFPITLKGRALRWTKSLPVGMINISDLLKKEFIWQYCSPFKTAKKLEEIHNFKQEMYETLYQAWERYNDLLFKCPQHDLNNHQKVQIFYTGLDISTRRILVSRGFITLMTPTQALKSIQTFEGTNRYPYRTRETVCMIENPGEVHKLKDQEDEGDMDVGWDITVEDVKKD
ncbi:ribonuclease H-like domain-containing protein [Tanacetum coccineum]